MLVFLDVKSKYPQLKSGNWKTDLAFFFVGVSEHLNNLKRHSSEKNLLIYELRAVILALKAKLLSFSKQIKRDVLTNFPVWKQVRIYQP
jgi:hypothetical protein